MKKASLVFILSANSIFEILSLDFKQRSICSSLCPKHLNSVKQLIGFKPQCRKLLTSCSFQGFLTFQKTSSAAPTNQLSVSEKNPLPPPPVKTELKRSVFYTNSINFKQIQTR